MTNSAKLSGRIGASSGAKLKKTAFGVGSSSSNPHRKLDDAKVNGGRHAPRRKFDPKHVQGGKAIRNKRARLLVANMMKTRAGGRNRRANGRVAQIAGRQHAYGFGDGVGQIP